MVQANFHKQNATRNSWIVRRYKFSCSDIRMPWLDPASLRKKMTNVGAHQESRRNLRIFNSFCAKCLTKG